MLKKISSLLVICLMLGAIGTMLMSCGGDGPVVSDSGSQDSNDVLDNSDTSDTESNDTTPTDTTPTDTTPKETTSTTKPTKPKKSIDVYIILGQSNAAGYTKIKDIDGSGNSATLASRWSNYKTGVSNIIYSGKAEATTDWTNFAWGGYDTNTVDAFGPVPVRMGLGRPGGTYIGAELGMAKVFSESYYKYDSSIGTTRNAAIIKYAHGGTSMWSTGSENATNGNWMSPSYAKQLGVDYTKVNGGMYRNAIEQIEHSCMGLMANGYNEIHIKGVFWMQGESDKGDPSRYETAFTYFVNDLRSDISSLPNIVPAVQRDGLSTLPIMIGEISETFGAADTGTVNANKTFIKKQNEIATKLTNVYVIKSAGLAINNASGIVGTDKYHWNAADMFTIGELVGECVLKNILKVK